MEGDREDSPRTFKDRPAQRNLHLFAPAGREYGDERLELLAESFLKEQANDPETIRAVELAVVPDVGRFAARMVVFGDHASLHKKAKNWEQLLREGDEENISGYMWRVDH